MPQAIGGNTQAPGHRGEDRHGSAGMRVNEIFEVAMAEAEDFRVLRGGDGGATRASVEQRKFAEEIATAGDLENDAFTGIILEENLHLASANDVERISRIVHLKQSVAGFDVDRVQLGSEFHPL